MVEQERPLAPEAHRIAVNDTATPPPAETKKNPNRRRCLRCCGCATAVLVILGVVILILALTVFKVKDPEVKLNYVTIKGLQGINVNPLNLSPNTNLTVVVDVSVKNPNAAAFKFRNATVRIYYEGVLIGEAQIPQGKAKANKTFKMKVSVDFLLQKILGVPRIVGDVAAGAIPVTAQTSVRGRVEIINIVKKTVGVKVDCSLTVIVQDQSVRDQKCKKHVSI